MKYDVGTLDYTFDARSVAAVKKFQKDNKVSSSGILDFTTQKLLNGKLTEIRQNMDNVYARAAAELRK